MVCAMRSMSAHGLPTGGPRNFSRCRNDLTARVPTGVQPQNATTLYLRGQSEALHRYFLPVLRHSGTRLTRHRRPAGAFLDEFVETFLTLSRSRITFPRTINPVRPAQRDDLEPRAAFALSRHAPPEVLRPPPTNFAKRLALCSARNTTTIDRRSFFDVDPVLACAWYSAYAELYRTGLLDPVVWKNLKEHFAFEDDRLDARHLPMIAYFGIHDVGENRDRVSDRLSTGPGGRSRNRCNGKREPAGPEENRGAERRLVARHSAYRITRAFVEALTGYHLTSSRSATARPRPELVP